MNLARKIISFLLGKKDKDKDKSKEDEVVSEPVEKAGPMGEVASEPVSTDGD